MNLSMTLSRYLAKTYILNMLGILFGLLALIYLFDTIELIRRANKTDNVSMTLVLQMGLLKLPEVGQILFPFAILFSAILTFWQLNRRSELVILKASGYSIWQSLTPLVILAMLIGILQVTAINPMGAILIGKYEQLENKYLSHQGNQIALFKGGLWLRQSTDGTPMGEQTHASDGYVIIHAPKIEQNSIEQKHWMLKNVTAFYFGAEDTLLMRLNSKTATLEKGQWLFKNINAYSTDGTSRKSNQLALPTPLTPQDIEESFSSPETMSFWNLPGHIKTLEETGFDAARLHVHYHNLLSQPLFLAAMILLAATVSMRPGRSGGTLILIASGIFTGFTVFFLSSYLQALGYSGQLPPILSAWSPALICTLLGLSTIMTLEDG